MPKNCWEFKQCGRQPGGHKTHELGVCPAATEDRVNGINHGKNAGRCCWVMAGTLCKGEIQGMFAQKIGNCMKCEFFGLVTREEGSGTAAARDVLKMLG
ncbi:MAG: two-CW domain-containing protein [Terracidiphilus sp.]|jgi:hypothetical protein